MKRGRTKEIRAVTCVAGAGGLEGWYWGGLGQRVPQGEPCVSWEIVQA